MKTILKALSLVLVLVLGVSCDRNKVNTSAVENLDLERYMGVWYEIGRYDIAFQRGLVGVTATYSIKDDGSVKVVNAGYENSLDGEFTDIEAKARRRYDDNTGRLEVAFFASFYSEYNVMELADDYSWALVGGANDKYLWILSRTPYLDSTILNDIILPRAAGRGYNTSKISWTEQPEE